MRHECLWGGEGLEVVVSMMRCERCENVVDTDYDLEGEWSDTGYTCERCCEREETEDKP